MGIVKGKSRDSLHGPRIIVRVMAVCGGMARCGKSRETLPLITLPGIGVERDDTLATYR